MKKNWIIEAVIIAIGVVVLGLCIQGGFESFANKDRKVTVKGLAEKEVPANKVTWPIVSKELGNDLPALYTKINSTTNAIKNFLKRNDIAENEIIVNPPKVIDLNADQYSSTRNTYRYNVTSVITVTSTKVDKVRAIIAKQGELLQNGIAIVDGGYDNPIKYDYTGFNSTKPKMMEEAIANAQSTADQFAKNSNSKINKIMSADQGQFSVEDRDSNTPYIKKIRVVTTVTYSLKN